MELQVCMTLGICCTGTCARQYFTCIPPSGDSKVTTERSRTYVCLLLRKVDEIGAQIFGSVSSVLQRLVASVHLELMRHQRRCLE